MTHDRLLGSPFARKGAPWDPTTFELEPHFGEIRWTPPAAYRAAAAAGLLGASREVVAIDATRGFTFATGDAFTSLNQDLVHMPAGVSRDAGDLSTNHLVGFAEAAGEAVWCFDVSAPTANGDYPVYYHHQDEPRARMLETGEWEEPGVEPDFTSFAQWLETMTAAMLADEPPAWFERLGQPGLTFMTKRLKLS